MKKINQFNESKILSRAELKQIGGLVQQGTTCVIQCQGGPPISYNTTGTCTVESRTVTISSSTEQVQVGIVENGQVVAGCTSNQPIISYT